MRQRGFKVRFASILLKNSEIEPLRKSRFRGRRVTSADSPYGRAYRRVAGGKTGQSAEPLRNFSSRRPAVSKIVIEAEIRVFQHRVMGGSSSRWADRIGDGLEEEAVKWTILLASYHYVGGISKCGDRRVRTLLYEAANVMLTRYNGQLKLKEWAFAIARRSSMREARIALARRLAIIMHAMLRDGTRSLRRVGPGISETETASSSRKERRPREGADDGVDFVAGTRRPTAFSTLPPCAQAYPIKRRRARRERRHPKASING